MLTPVVVSILVGLVSAQSPDPSCVELKTPLRADDCCEIPDTIQESIIQRCVDEVGDDDLVCIEECVAKQMGVLKNGILDKDALAKFLTNTLGKDSNFGPIIGDVFERCHSQMVTIPTRKDGPLSQQCDSRPDFMINCIDSALFQNCPAKLWKESEGCAELKGKLAKGCPFIAIMGEDD